MDQRHRDQGRLRRQRKQPSIATNVDFVGSRVVLGQCTDPDTTRPNKTRLTWIRWDGCNLYPICGERRVLARLVVCNLYPICGKRRGRWSVARWSVGRPKKQGCPTLGKQLRGSGSREGDTETLPRKRFFSLPSKRFFLPPVYSCCHPSRGGRLCRKLFSLPRKSCFPRKYG